MILAQALTSDTVISINLGLLLAVISMIISGVIATIRFNNRIKDIENRLSNSEERINDYKESSAQKIAELKVYFKEYTDRIEKNSKIYYGQLSEEIKDLKTLIEEQNESMGDLKLSVGILIDKSK